MALLTDAPGIKSESQKAKKPEIRTWKARPGRFPSLAKTELSTRRRFYLAALVAGLALGFAGAAFVSEVEEGLVSALPEAAGPPLRLLHGAESASRLERRAAPRSHPVGKRAPHHS